MDIEKLIEQLRKSADFENYPIVASFAAIIEKKYLRDAATALSTLRAENEQLRAELERVKKIMRDNGISMKRLTKYICGHAHGAEGIKDDDLTGSYCRGEFEATAIVDRLAAIEDILGDEYDLDDLKTAMWCKETVGMAFSEDTAPVERLRELWFADKDGRCVVLPCKIDDDVYINLFGRTLDATVISISELASTPTYKAMYGIRLCYIFKADDVGRTVFLTREAAEEALKAREQE